MPKRTPDWARLDPLIDRLRDKRFNDTQIARELGIARQTLVDHLRSREPVHLSTPKRTDTTEVHQSTPEPQGTLEGHQQVMEDVQQSVPEAPHISTEEPYQSTPEHQSVPQQPDSPEVHPSTPEVHRNMSGEASGVLEEYSGVPARQGFAVSTPMVHPGTPTAEDGELWTSIRAQWREVENMLAERHTRHALLSIPPGTPRHTVKKTYVVDTFYVELIDRYAKEHSLDLKDVLNFAFQRFFEQEGYLSK